MIATNVTHHTDKLSARELAAYLREVIGLTSPNRRIAQSAWWQLDQRVSMGSESLPFCVQVAMLGISWAVNTGRLNAETAMAVRGLSNWHMVTLVADVARACPVQGDVPAYLRARFAA